MGLSSKKTKTSSTSTGTATTTPQVPDFIRGPATNYFGQIGNLLNSGTPAGTPASSLQNQAFSGASNLSLNPAIMQAMNGTRGLMNFSPDSVTAGQLRDTDLSPYMNPYTQNVIDTTAADMERARQGAISQGQGRATMSGAYGGSRHGVADAETNSGFFRDLGSIIANLRNTGFQNAQGAALTDIGNRLSADTGNADRGVTGAGVRLAAANQLGAQGEAADNSTRANVMTQAALGGQQRDITQQNDPNQIRIQQLAQIARLLGIDPGMFTGQTVNQSSSGTGSQTSNPSFMDSLGQAVQIGTALFSDRRLKTDAVLLGVDESGNRWWRYRYLWDAEGTERVGVMADEAPEAARHMHPSGFWMVDYSALAGVAGV